MKGDGLNPPKVNRTIGMQGEVFLYIGNFIDNVRRYPRGTDWIEVEIRGAR